MKKKCTNGKSHACCAQRAAAGVFTVGVSAFIVSAVIYAGVFLLIKNTSTVSMWLGAPEKLQEIFSQLAHARISVPFWMALIGGGIVGAAVLLWRKAVFDKSRKLLLLIPLVLLTIVLTLSAFCLTLCLTSINGVPVRLVVPVIVRILNGNII